MGERKRSILVTGANGFIGRACCRLLLEKGYHVIACVRHHDHFIALTSFLSASPSKKPIDIHLIQPRVIYDIAQYNDWDGILSICDTVIHLAARVHQMHAVTREDHLYYAVNTHATELLAEASRKAGLRRFILISSIKAMGENSSSDIPDHHLTINDIAQPSDAYGKSKRLAEKAIQRIFADSATEYVILRPPLVYGPGVKANFAKLISILKLRLPLPLASIHNQRSFIFVGNLVEIIEQCVISTAVANNTYLVSDHHDVSTPELLRELGKALDIPVYLFPVPSRWLQKAAYYLGKQDITSRLLGSLTLDSSPIYRDLNLNNPPYSLNEAFSAAFRSPAS